MAREPVVIRTFDTFLRAAIHRYWESPGRDRVTFLALLFATRESWPVAFERLGRADTQRKALLTSAGVVAVTLLLRTLLGGPIGLLLTAGSLAGLAQLYIQRAPDIRERSTRIRRLLAAYRPEVESTLASGRSGALTDDQVDLMVEGLLGRFLRDIEPSDAKASEVESEEETFAAHVAKKRGAPPRH